MLNVEQLTDVRSALTTLWVQNHKLTVLLKDNNEVELAKPLAVVRSALDTASARVDAAIAERAGHAV